MFKEISKLNFLILIVGLLTLLQSFGFSVLGVKPNLALVAVATVSFFAADFWQGFLLVILAAFILKFAPGFEEEILVFSLIGAAIVIAKNYLPWNNFLNNLSLVAVGTILFYLLLAPSLILSVVFLEELFLNLVCGIMIFALMSFLWQTK